MKLALNKNQKREPYGGHHFVEQGITFKGDTFDEVIEKVADFRKNNNYPAGDPVQDVLIFYVKHWPYMVTDDLEPKEEVPIDTKYLEWRDWIYKVWQNPPKKFLTTKEAQDRWKVCETCPFNQKKDWAKSDESTELKRRQYLLTRGIAYPSFLGFCSLHRADLGVIVFTDQPVSLSSKKDGGHYEKCWVV